MVSEDVISYSKMILSGKLTDEEIEKLIGETLKHKKTLRGFLVRKLCETNMSVEDLSSRANLGRSTIYKIISGKMKPAGDRLLQIAFALKLTGEETQQLLCLGEQAQLNTNTERSIRIMCALNKHLMLEEIDDILIKRGLKPISEKPLSEDGTYVLD